MKFTGEISHIWVKFMAVEMSLDSEYKIVVNAGRRTFQGEETESRSMEVGKQECEDAQKAGTRPI